MRLALLALVACSSPKPQPPKPPVVAPGAITMSVQPSPTFVEVGDGAQYVNCDLIVTNASAVAWQLGMLQVEAFDATGALVLRKLVDGSGVSPGIQTIPNRALPARGKLLILNPLFAFPRDAELAMLRFTVTYEREGASSQTATADVAPVVYEPRAELHLPLSGRLLVWDGHDFFAHHRRWDYLSEPIRAFGFTSNVGRYSYDFVIVDEQGRMSSGDEAVNASWFSFGKPVRTPAAGTVVAVEDSRPDDRTIDMAALKTNLMAVYGNYVVIDHGNGELSMLGHIQHRSAKVAVGAQVTAGQVVAAVGASGSSMFPHLHYQLQSTADGQAEGLPSYFVKFARLRGVKRIEVERGTVESGEILDVR